MRKRVLSFCLAAMMLLGTTGAASAVEERASYTLDDYYVGLSAEGGGTMLISAVVNGVGKQDKIGVQQIDIEYRTSLDEEWEYYDSMYAAEHPEFYTYKDWSYLGDIYFDGEVGHYYRVTLTVYAKKGSLFDTGHITSPGVRCK